MRLPRETLFRPSGQIGYRQGILQKVSILLSLLYGVSRNEDLSSRFVLKGGTAINLFFLRIPRLPIDIDIDYL